MKITKLKKKKKTFMNYEGSMYLKYFITRIYLLQLILREKKNVKFEINTLKQKA